MRRDPIKLLKRLREHGDVAFLWVGPIPTYLFSHPDHVREILVMNYRRYMKGYGLQELKRRIVGTGLLTSELPFHRRQRRMVQPALHHKRIAAHADWMAAAADRAQARWKDGAALDMHQEMINVTLTVVAKSLFDADIESATPTEFEQAVATALRKFNRLITPDGVAAEAGSSLTVDAFQDAKDSFDHILYAELTKRRAASEDRGDLLSMMLAARDEQGEPMTDQELRDELATLFVAGHRTTATALAWAWYVLSQNPAAEAALHEEIDRVLGDRVPTFEDLASLVHTRRVLAETIRLYPPVWSISRVVLEEHEMAGYTIPAGAIVVVSPYLVHRDPRWYPDPERFDPGRWTDEEQEKRPKFSYFPFGAGPRVCVGESFAWMEATMILSTMARRWQARLVKGHPTVPDPKVTIRPEFDLPMDLERWSG
jgi:cytochrome P450